MGFGQVFEKSGRRQGDILRVLLFYFLGGVGGGKELHIRLCKVQFAKEGIEKRISFVVNY